MYARRTLVGIFILGLAMTLGTGQASAQIPKSSSSNFSITYNNQTPASQQKPGYYSNGWYNGTYYNYGYYQTPPGAWKAWQPSTLPSSSLRTRR